MIKTYTGIKGFTVSFFFMAGLILILSVFFWGITKAVELFLPILIVLSYLLIVIFLLGFLPATFFKDLRPSLCMYSVWMSHALGVSAWVLSFFYVIKAFGFLGIFFIFLFQFLAPMALVGAIFKGSWHIVGHLSLWISFTYGMRYYSQWLLKLNSREQQEKDIIDVDAIAK
jgi:hypothetical protein